jgi:membrane protease YdiL (CAAX protease family)
MLPSIDPATGLFLYWIVILMPVLAWMSYRRLQKSTKLAPKIRRFQLSVTLLILTGVVSIQAAHANDVQISFQGGIWSMIYASLIVTVLLAAIVRGRHRQPAEHRERIRLLYAPTRGAEYAWSIAGGTIAGIVEEIAYRAVLYELLGRSVGYGFSLLISVVVFVLAHLPQGLRGAVGVTMLATIFHIVYVLSGSLLAPVLIHAIYDIGLFTILFLDERKRAAVPQPAEQPA